MQTNSLDFYPPAMPITAVPGGYMCQVSPPQTSAVPVPPRNLYPTLVSPPPPTPHNISLLKGAIIPNAFPPHPSCVPNRVHLPGKFMQILQRPMFAHNKESMITTCCHCQRENTLLALWIDEVVEAMKQDYELKRYLMNCIQFETFPGEEISVSIANNNLNYSQSSDLCRVSNLRANANEFTPAQKNPTAKVELQNTNDCELHQPPPSDAVDSCIPESGIDSGLHDSGVSDSGNQDSTITDSYPETCRQSDNVNSALDIYKSTESLKTDGSEHQRSNIKKTNRKKKFIKDNRTNEYEPRKTPDNNQNYFENSYENKRPPNERRQNGYLDPSKPNPLAYVSYNSRPNDRDRPRSSQYSKGRADQYNDRNSYYKDSRSRNNYNASYDKPPKVESIVQEVEGDLFSTDADNSLVHCVAEDLRMGAGIAVQFRKQYGGVAELLDQRKSVGQVAYLKRENRYIFYLITKKLSYMKPTLHSLKQTLTELSRLCSELNVKKLAMPRIGCGLDKLDWDDVKNALNVAFQHSNVEIVAYHFREEETANADAPVTGKMKSSLRVREVPYPLGEIESCTAMVVYGSKDGLVDAVSKRLNDKFPYVEEFAKLCRNDKPAVGEFIPIYVNKEYVCVFIVKDTQSAPFQFTKLERCILQLNKFLKKEKYQFVGIDRINEGDDSLINEKIITVFRGHLWTNVELYVCSCTPRKSEYQSSASKTNNSYPTNSTASSTCD